MSERFGEVARAARTAADVSLRTLADRLGWTPAYLSDIERGNRAAPSTDKARQWAEIVGADPDEFEWLALLDRPAVELSTTGAPIRSRIAVTLARAWEEMTPEQEEALLEQLTKIFGGQR